MKTHIFEHMGAMFHCEYTYRPGEEGTAPDFRSVRVAGADYKPTGPELLPFLITTLLMENEPECGICAARPFFSAVSGDILGG